ncbi:hypothetical protein [Alistipes communis]|uniref:hypothetical protein n=1 Tax=Alistipes communis TaxID=2585118 RepID=UPI0011414A84|nr:hypothetical protein [Alistipes communis]
MQTSLPVGELGHVAPSGTGRELHAADTRMACAQGVDEVALVVEQPPPSEKRGRPSSPNALKPTRQEYPLTR